ncbi:MAG: molybdopterin-dependent oxidoreductase [Euryarchaeota archaeon]|nr:molybdopterin-dependent oxidoreductase [Euryarchaeota archaeon]
MAPTPSGPSETRFTFCRICEAACGIRAEVRDGRVVSLRPDPDHPVSRGYSCVKGTRGILSVQNDPERLKHPVKKKGEGWERISWDQALREIGGELRRIRREHGRRSLGVYFGNPTAFSYSHGPAMLAFTRAYGTPNVFSAGSQDCNNKFVASRLMFGSSLIQPCPDIDRTRFLLMFGANPLVSHFSFVTVPRPHERLQAIIDRGGRVVSVNPRRTETARRVGEHLFIRPDTDLFLLLALLNVIFQRGLHDEPYLRRWTRGWERVREAARPHTPEKTAAVTGIPAPAIRRLAVDFARAPGAVAYTRTGTSIGHFGTLTEAAIHWLNLATGNMDRPGGAFAGGGGLLDLPPLGRLGGADRSRERSRIGNHPKVLQTFPAAILADEILTPGPGQIRAMVVTAGNPVLSCPGGRRLAEALEDLDLLVSLDLYINETGSLADYVLPATTFLERDDLWLPAVQFQPIPYAQYTGAVVPPDGEQRTEWDIFLGLTEAAGLDPGGIPGAGPLLKMARGLPLLGPPRPQWMLSALLRLFGEVDLTTLRRHPHGLLLKPRRYGEWLRRGPLTPGHRIRMVTPELEGELERAREFLGDLRENRNGGLILIGLRELRSHNSWMHNALRPREGCLAYLNPRDGKRLGLTGGQAARIEGPGGHIEVPVSLTDDIMPGVIAVPHGWGHTFNSGQSRAREQPGACVNYLASEKEVEPLAGMSVLNGIRVRVSPS